MVMMIGQWDDAYNEKSIMMMCNDNDVLPCRA